MMAFLSGPLSIPLNSPGRHARSMCRCRPPIPRPARVVFSALIDEKKALSEPGSDSQAEPTSLQPIEQERVRKPSFSERPRPYRPSRVSPTGGARNYEDRPRFEADPDATYYTKCSRCSAAYEIDPTVLSSGRKVACSVCGNEWFQKPERLYTLRTSEEFTDYPMDRKDELLQQSQRGQNQRGRHPGRRRDRQYAQKSFSVFIGNLPFSVSTEELKEFISNVVTPKRVAVVVDADGRSKGYAFADVNSGDEVDQLVNALDNTSLKGRNIAVKPGKNNS
ncbi:unnamed protein product [Agarophyton chilense]